MYRLLYSALWYILCPFIVLRLWRRSRINPDYATHWQQRFGHLDCANTPRIWLHAVSVGETVAAKPLVEALLKQYPHHVILLTNTTPTGLQTSHRLFGERVEHAYFPYDLPHVIRRFLKRVKPSLLIIMETEIWPNLLHHCGQQQIPVVIANARLSPRSTHGYAKVKRIIAPALEKVSTIACRSQEDSDHFLKLGATQTQITVSGNIKFDVANSQPKETLISPVNVKAREQRKIWVAASTHQGEDELILDIYRQLKSTYTPLVLVLVPRHPERFGQVFTLCEQTNYIVAKRSQHPEMLPTCDILLGDSMGEMETWYAIADVVFVGGSLVDVGGHNPLEALQYGVPVVSGPATFNFTDVYQTLTENGIAWVEHDQQSVKERLHQLLARSHDESLSFKGKAQTLLTRYAGVTGRLMEQVKKHLSPG